MSRQNPAGQGVSGEVQRYEHSCGFSLSVPVGWQERTDKPASAVFVVADPVPRAGFFANVVVTAQPIPPGHDPSAWLTAVVEDDGLDDDLLLDLEWLDDGLGGTRARRLISHVVPDAVPVTAEQWSMVRADTGYLLTVSVSTPAYADLADVMTSIGRSWTFAP